jgi:hypothetical protein
MSEIEIITSIINEGYRNFYNSYGKECEHKKDVRGFADDIYVDGFFFSITWKLTDC